MNAIIVAAGFGSRLRPLTYSTPKPLIEVFNKPIIEKNIEFLLEKGIKDIYIIVGYLREKFEYLKNKYPEIKLIYNNKYGDYNNIYSLYLVKDYLENSYIFEGDIYLRENLFQVEEKQSCAYCKKILNKNNEWQMIVDDENYVKKIEIGGENNYIISGPRFLKKEDSIKLKNLLEVYCKDEEKKKYLFWDDVLKENIDQFKIKVKEVSSNDIYEIDTLEDLILLDDLYKNIERVI